eukprot:CAMPEP_0185743004 /NCGR_PEP_ID=MMETSP1174-20130828/564_1 /TAXON_ID=35687 /ORGANISM="Dictyocha speculum, Strain CCMP1381" /LENGTH=54 /DNA_ID=CAMNT_0028415367 /DNA_START=44 /DNA_END=208 /DNA_ORIENTATION=-
MMTKLVKMRARWKMGPMCRVRLRLMVDQDDDQISEDESSMEDGSDVPSENETDG